jgi:hypothetical protein
MHLVCFNLETHGNESLDSSSEYELLSWVFSSSSESDSDLDSDLDSDSDS